MRYCKWFSAGNRGSLLYRRNRRSAWRSDRFVDPAESNNRSANRNVDDLDQSSTDGGILDSVRTIKNSKTVKTVLICNAIIDLAVTPYLPVYTGNRFMACIIGGVLVGIGMAIVFMSGSTTGGSDIGAKLIQKYFPHIQTGTALMVLDLNYYRDIDSNVQKCRVGVIWDDLHGGYKLCDRYDVIRLEPEYYDDGRHSIF